MKITKTYEKILLTQLQNNMQILAKFSAKKQPIRNSLY